MEGESLDSCVVIAKIAFLFMLLYRPKLIAHQVRITVQETRAHVLLTHKGDTFEMPAFRDRLFDFPLEIFSLYQVWDFIVVFVLLVAALLFLQILVRFSQPPQRCKRVGAKLI